MSFGDECGPCQLCAPLELLATRIPRARLETLSHLICQSPAADAPIIYRLARVVASDHGKATPEQIFIQEYFGEGLRTAAASLVANPHVRASLLSQVFDCQAPRKLILGEKNGTKPNEPIIE
jgi:hypothetical protein